MEDKPVEEDILEVKEPSIAEKDQPKTDDDFFLGIATGMLF